MADDGAPPDSSTPQRRKYYRHAIQKRYGGLVGAILFTYSVLIFGIVLLIPLVPAALRASSACGAARLKWLNAFVGPRVHQLGRAMVASWHRFGGWLRRAQRVDHSTNRWAALPPRADGETAGRGRPGPASQVSQLRWRGHARASCVLQRRGRQSGWCPV